MRSRRRWRDIQPALDEDGTPPQIPVKIRLQKGDDASKLASRNSLRAYDW